MTSHSKDCNTTKAKPVLSGNILVGDSVRVIAISKPIKDATIAP